MKPFWSSFTICFQIATILAVFVFASTLVLGVNINPQFNYSTNGCLFDSSESCMGVSEHILAWQNTFNISPESNILILVIALLVILGSLLFISFPKDERHLLCEWYKRIVFIFMNKWRETHSKLFDFIRLYFSDGILHPKLF